MAAKYHCPLCDSPLSRSKYEEVLNIQKSQKNELEQTVRQEKRRLNEAFREKLAAARNKARDWALKQIKREIGNAGRATPQDFGLASEESLRETLAEAYPRDHVIRTGQAGDVVQTVLDIGKHCGIIAYECKRKLSIGSADIRDAIKAKRKTKADFSVLVHCGTRKGFGGIAFIEGIYVVSPAGVLVVAALLRELLIHMSKIGLDARQRQAVARQLVAYVDSTDFRSPLEQILQDAADDNYDLEREKSAHERWWKERLIRSARTLYNAEIIDKCIESALLGAHLEPYQPFPQRQYLRGLTTESVKGRQPLTELPSGRRKRRKSRTRT
jgi:hypothetical protein